MIRLYYYKNNFGDELNPYILSKLSNQKVVFRKPFSVNNFIFDGLRFIKYLLKGKLNFDYISYSPFNRVIIAIGSILEESTNNCLVWGAGIGSKDVKIAGGTFLAVRGQKSQFRLSELSYPVPNVVGDPAILLPLIYPSNKDIIKKYKYGIIPHKSDFNSVKDNVKSSDLVNKSCVINLETSNIENVIDEILSCERIISSSLHGIIVAHAYGIPCLRFIEGKLYGDGVKFDDYFSSVNVKPYEPIRIDNISEKIISDYFSAYEENSVVGVNISDVQKGLISVAPFKVLEKYKNLL